MSCFRIQYQNLLGRFEDDHRNLSTNNQFPGQDSNWPLPEYMWQAILLEPFCSVSQCHTFPFQFRQEHNVMACTLLPGILLNNQEFKMQGTAIMEQFMTITDGRRVLLTWKSRLKWVLFFEVIHLLCFSHIILFMDYMATSKLELHGYIFFYLTQIIIQSIHRIWIISTFFV
jgi:hypothetical protein